GRFSWGRRPACREANGRRAARPMGTSEPVRTRVAYPCPLSPTVRSASMNRNFRRLTVVALLLLAGPAVAAPPTEAEIKTAIQQLGDERFAVREKAMKALWQAGPAVEALLREALNNPDPEVVKRVRTLLDRILYRIEPDTPAEIVTMMQKYKAGTADEQIAVVKDLLKLGNKSHVYLLRLLDAVDEARRRAWMDQF